MGCTVIVAFGDKNVKYTFLKLSPKVKKALTLKFSVLFSVQIIQTRTDHCHFNNLEQRRCIDLIIALSLYTVFHSFKAGHRNYEFTRDTLLIEIWLYFSRKIYVYLFYNFFLIFFGPLPCFKQEFTIHLYTKN